MTQSLVAAPEGGAKRVDAPPRRRGRPAKARAAWVLPTATTLAVFVVLDVMIRSGVLGVELPNLAEVGEALLSLLSENTFWDALVGTAVPWLVGFGLGVLIAVPLGLLIASSHFLVGSTRLLIDFLRPIPPVAVLPLAVLVLGSDTQMKIVLVVFSTVWPILFQTMYGAQDVDPVTRDTARAYGIGRLSQYIHVVLPSATPYIATGMRLASAIALVVTIATELVVGDTGVGYLINQARYAGDDAGMYALVFVAGALGWFSSQVFRLLERRVLKWHHSQRGEVDA